MTVKELKKLCAEVVKEGFGDYNVIISNDEEGNGYHDLFYPFMTDTKTVKNAVKWSCCSMDVSDVEHSVILG